MQNKQKHLYFNHLCLRDVCVKLLSIILYLKSTSMKTLQHSTAIDNLC